MIDATGQSGALGGSEAAATGHAILQFVPSGHPICAVCGAPKCKIALHSGAWAEWDAENYLERTQVGDLGVVVPREGCQAGHPGRHNSKIGGGVRREVRERGSAAAVAGS